MPLDLDTTLTPDDLCAATRSELLEYLANVNAVAKAMHRDHLGHAVRHAQMNAVVSEIERRELVRILTA